MKIYRRASDPFLFVFTNDLTKPEILYAGKHWNRMHLGRVKQALHVSGHFSVNSPTTELKNTDNAFLVPPHPGE